MRILTGPHLTWASVLAVVDWAPFSVETERLAPAEEETPEAVAVAAVLQRKISEIIFNCIDHLASSDPSGLPSVAYLAFVPQLANTGEVRHSASRAASANPGGRIFPVGDPTSFCSTLIFVKAHRQLCKTVHWVLKRHSPTDEPH